MKKLIILTLLITAFLHISGCAKLKGQKAKRLYIEGLDHIISKDYEKAVVAFNKSIEVWPDVPMTHFSLGTTYLLLKKHDSALTEFKKTVEYNPRGYLTYSKMAEVYLFQNKFDQAEKMFKKSLSLININDKGNIIKLNISIGDLFYKYEKFEKALPFYQKASKLNEFKIIFYIKQALVYDALKNKSKAYELYKKAETYVYTIRSVDQEKLPYFAGLYNNIAKEEENRTLYNLALSYYVKTLDIFPKNEIALKSIDRIRKTKKDASPNLNEAINEENSQKKVDKLVNFLKQNGDNVRALNHLSNAYLENGQIKKAKKSYKLTLKYGFKFNKLRDKNKLSKIYISLADTYQQTNETYKAIEIYVKGYDLLNRDNKDRTKIIEKIRDTYLSIWK